MNNDQNQIRDVQAKIRDAQDRISTLTRDGQKLQSTTPRGNVLTAELNNINTQINNTKGFSAKLSQQETALNSDIADQKKCIDVAQSGLNSILANPAQPILDQKKK
jgi:predicted  nucleic acid-binding Zn-ribbon protein